MKLIGKAAGLAAVLVLAGPAVAEKGKTPEAAGTAKADTGNKDDDRVGHSSFENLNWLPMPEPGSKHTIFFQSQDGRLASGGAQMASISFSNSWTYDNIGYVISGTSRMVTEEGSTVELKAGDVFYVANGTKANIIAGANFNTVHFLSSATPLDLSHAGRKPASAPPAEACPPAPAASSPAGAADAAYPGKGIRIWHAPLDSLSWTPMEGANEQQKAQQHVLFRAADGKRLGAAFKLSGSFSSTFTFDEVGYVVSGSAHVSIKGGQSYDLKAGDLTYWSKGASATVETSPDYKEIVVISAQCPFGQDALGPEH